MLPTPYYADWDEDSGLWCVFSYADHNAHAFSSWATKDQAESDAVERNQRIKQENLNLSLEDEVEGAKNKLWPPEFSAHAQSEGWDVFDVDGEFLEISKFDENSPFANDYEAMQWVLNRYISGCFVAARALSISLFRVNSMT